jgi:hypothetical protein
MSGYPISIIGLCQEGKSSPEALQERGYRNLIHRRVVLTSRPWFLSLGEPDFHLLVQLLRPPRLGLCFPASLETYQLEHRELALLHTVGLTARPGRLRAEEILYAYRRSLRGGAFTPFH